MIELSIAKENYTLDNGNKGFGTVVNYESVFNKLSQFTQLKTLVITDINSSYLTNKPDSLINLDIPTLEGLDLNFLEGVTLLMNIASIN